jgi:hypothetical protein
MHQPLLQATSADRWRVAPRLRALRKAGLLLAAAAAVLLAPMAQAAMCQEGRAPNTTKNEFRLSRLVVMGHVIDTVKHSAAHDPDVVESIDYTFQVERQMKGKRVRTLVINSKSGPTAFPMNEQRRYLLFVLQGPDSKWYVDNCGNSATMSRPVKRPPVANKQR